MDNDIFMLIRKMASPGYRNSHQFFFEDLLTNTKNLKKL